MSPLPTCDTCGQREVVPSYDQCEDCGGIALSPLTRLAIEIITKCKNRMLPNGSVTLGKIDAIKELRMRGAEAGAPVTDAGFMPLIDAKNCIQEVWDAIP